MTVSGCGPQRPLILLTGATGYVGRDGLLPRSFDDLGASFEQQDRRGAANFAPAAHEAGVRRVVYLGGLGAGTGVLRSRPSSRSTASRR